MKLILNYMEKRVTNIARILLVGYCLVASAFAMAQSATPALERKINIELSQATIKETLKIMEAQGGYTFAYRTSIIDNGQYLSRNYVNLTTREVLDDLFQGNLSYKQKGNYIVLKEKSTIGLGEVSLDGYVKNAITGEPIVYATIFDPYTLSSAISDEYGRYEIKFKHRTETKITVKKEGYRDTTISWTNDQNTILNFNLTPLVLEANQPEIDTSKFSDRFKNIRLFNLSDEQKANFKNFGNNLKKKSQFSVIPKVGTHGDLTPTTTYNNSFNLLGGSVGGVKRFEIGGIFNIDYDTVQYFQLASVFNLVGGPQRGFQLSGITNLNKSSFSGLQIAGIYNQVEEFKYGVQLAGIANRVDSDFTGIQISGIVNKLQGRMIGIQVAGIANHTKGDVYGLQVAGIFNRANTVFGSQVGLFNYSDSIAGVPIGLLSFSKKGMHQLELSYNELHPFNIGFKTGAKVFYNYLSFGFNPNQGNSHWAIGYGFGTSVKLNSKNRLNFDLQAKFFDGKDYPSITEAISTIGTFRINYERRLTKNLGIAMGPSINVLTAGRTGSNDNIYALLSRTIVNVNQANTLWPGSTNTYDIYTGNDFFSKMWIGYNISLNLF